MGSYREPGKELSLSVGRKSTSWRSEILDDWEDREPGRSEFVDK